MTLGLGLGQLDLNRPRLGLAIPANALLSPVDGRVLTSPIDGRILTRAA